MITMRFENDSTVLRSRIERMRIMAGNTFFSFPTHIVITGSAIGK